MPVSSNNLTLPRVTVRKTGVGNVVLGQRVFPGPKKYLLVYIYDTAYRSESARKRRLKPFHSSKRDYGANDIGRDAFFVNSRQGILFYKVARCGWLRDAQWGRLFLKDAFHPFIRFCFTTFLSDMDEITKDPWRCLARRWMKYPKIRDGEPLFCCDWECMRFFFVRVECMV